METDERYQTAVMLWAASHDADHHDMTVAQRSRYRLHNRCLDLGLDPNRVTFAAYLRATGRIRG